MLNRFSSPFSEGFYRALLGTLSTFIVSTGGSYLVMDRTQVAAHDRWEIAIITGLVSAFAPFAVGTAIARSDQNRAEANRPKPADVPVFARAEMSRSH